MSAKTNDLRRENDSSTIALVNSGMMVGMARPLTFVARYLRQQLDFAHFVTAALAAVGCSGIKTLIDAFASPPYGSTGHLDCNRLAGLVGCDRQSALVARELDRQRRICEGDRRPPI